MEGAAAAEASPAVAAAAVPFACVRLRSEYLYSAASALLAASAALGFGEARTDASGPASRRASTAARVSGSNESREGAALDSSAAGGANVDGGGGGGDADAFFAIVEGSRPSPVARAARNLVTLGAESAAAGRLVVPAIAFLEVKTRRGRN